MRDKAFAFTWCVGTKKRQLESRKTMQLGEQSAIWRNMTASNSRLQRHSGQIGVHPMNLNEVHAVQNHQTKNRNVLVGTVFVPGPPK